MTVVTDAEPRLNDIQCLRVVSLEPKILTALHSTKSPVNAYNTFAQIVMKSEGSMLP